jgi:hypothetical protein
VALTDLYVTLNQLKPLAGIPLDSTNDDDALTTAITSTSRGIEKVCHRTFNDAGSASARVYHPQASGRVIVDDFHTTVPVIKNASDYDSGVFDVTWAAGDYELRPLNGIVDGQPGWPWNRIYPVGDRSFPMSARRASVEVTARWGWAEVPAPVKQACIIVALEAYKLKDAPLGVAGVGDMGVMRVRSNQIAMDKLEPYITRRVLVA